MRVIAKKRLREFWEKHEDAEQALKAWFWETEHANWVTPADIRTRYKSVDFITGERAIFNIKGNHYRLIVKISWTKQIVWIRFIGTHREYERVDATKV